MYKLIRAISVIFSMIVMATRLSTAAEVKEIYGPLLEDGKFLYEGAFSYFGMDEDGRHGGANYDRFYSSPSYYSFDNSLRCHLLPAADLILGFTEYPYSSYKRTTYNPTNSINSVQKYELESMQHYKAGLKVQLAPLEFGFHMTERREKANWNWHIYPDDPPDYFSYIESEYREYSFGMKYLSEGGPSGDTSSLSAFTSPLLSARQFSLGSEWIYRSGSLKRNNPYYFRSGLYYNYYHALKPHLRPDFSIRCGITDRAEITLGAAYTFPTEYEFDYITYYSSNNTSLFTSGDYVLDNNFYLPIGLRMRPFRNFEIEASSDMSFTHQSLDVTRKNTNNTVTVFPSRSLDCFEVKPSVKLSYLYDAGKDLAKDRFTAVTERFLMKAQALAELRYAHDAVSLRKNADDGALNLIDPYSIFAYPADYFVAGSERSTFFLGDNSGAAANANAQNYSLFEARAVYGVTDRINLGLGGGYRTESAFHHMSLPDMQSRSYRIKGYFYLDPSASMRLTDNSLLSFRMHIVPQYVTFMQNSGYPKEFKSETEYIDMSASVKVMF